MAEILLAPIRGMTEAYLREIMANVFGSIDVYYAPFIATSHMRRNKNQAFNDILPENNPTQAKLIPQLIGNIGADFAHYAKVIQAMGYDEINWNIGCPYPLITKKKKGSGILPYPELTKAFLDEVCKDKNYRLTVKMRLGLNQSDEGLATIKVLNQYPIDTVIIHARYGYQKYEGTVHLDEFDKLVQLCEHPIVYNGDIFTKDDYTRLKKRYPNMDAFMIGRGILRNPFLPSEINGATYTDKEKQDKLIQYHNEVYQHLEGTMSTERLLTNKLKEFWTYACYQMDQPDIFLETIRKTPDLKAYHHIIDTYFNR